MSCGYDYIDSGGRAELPGQSGFGSDVEGAQSYADTHAITLDEDAQVIVVCTTHDYEPTLIHHMEWNMIKVDTLNIQAQS